MSGLEDCRDYLRTGRCKYGASCKYNHPANVQSGGGVKPSDPNEPLFPIRPNEPVCQYFMKHGTCKFGQACKFHHPHPNSVQVISVGQLPMVNVGGPIRKVETSPQLILNPLGPDPNGQGIVLQFLPQRPDEPDCIYFLKNGRCKYGATCRYHHPIHPSQARKSLDQKPRQSRQPVQYITQMVHSFPSQSGQVIMHPADSTPVSFINIDNTSYQIIPGNDGGMSYCIPTSNSVVVTEQGSSASSLASSYETVQDHLDGSQWSRSKRTGSGGSLSAFGSQQQQHRSFLTHSASEGNMTRRFRSDSYGASSDHGVQQVYESASSVSSGLPRNGSVGSWTQRVQGTHYIVRQEQQQQLPSSGLLQGSALPTAQPRFIRRRSHRAGDGGEGNDQGFTMMTSALLHMLDTPEEAASAESYSDEEYRQHVSDQPYYEDHQQHIDASAFERMSLLGPSAVPQQRHQQTAYGVIDPSMFERLSLRDHSVQNLSNQASLPSARSEDTLSPTWHEQPTLPDDEPNHAMAMMMHQQPHAPGASNSSHDTDIGLYLP